MSTVAIAKVCYEANRAYCSTLGDESHPQWINASQWMKESAVKGVRFHQEHPDSRPCHGHEFWLKEKTRDGWKYGPVKDAEKKEHPCFVPYDELPPKQQIKDKLFVAIVRTLT